MTRPRSARRPLGIPIPTKGFGAELQAILAQMRAAKSMPWDDDRTALYRTIFPQMTNCLPEYEGAQLRFDFEAELARLKAA